LPPRFKLNRIFRVVVVVALALEAASCWSAEVQPYPPGWPELAGMSADCREVAGMYVDPNRMHWQSVEQHGGVTSKRGGSLEAAWPAFGFLDYDRLRLNDSSIRQRAFSIAFAPDGDLVIDYYLERNGVSTRRLDRSKWACDKNGLHATTLERKGVISDLIPNRGWSRRSVSLHRVGSELFVKEINESTIYYLHVLPVHDHEERWHRFPVVDLPNS
jgi:hypothetical protein